MADTTSRKVIEYIADTTDVLRKIGEMARANQQMSQRLGKDFTGSLKTINQGVGKLSKTEIFDAQGIQTSSKAVESFSQQIKSADGSMSKYTETMRVNADGTKSVTRSYGDLDKNTVSLGENISRLVKRAAITIPVWLALRGAMMLVSSTIKNGITDVIAFDLALQKVKRNMQGSTDQINANFDTMKQQITEFSLQTGISTEIISEAIKKFASLGFSFEESLAGGLGAAKLSIILFGDAADTADAFARALNLLIDRSKGAKAPIQQMNEMFALTAELEKSNQFEINEAAESLKNFAGVAKSLGITGKETLAILASLGTNMLSGAKGGTLASAAFQQLVGNMKKVGKTIGVEVNPNLQSTTQIFTSVIEAIKKLGQTDLTAQTTAINELFGGLKGAKPVRALIADLDRLQANLKIAAGESENLDDAMSKVLNTISGQAKVFVNLRKEIGKVFIQGITGSEDFVDSLKAINKFMAGLRDSAESLGYSFKLAFDVATFQIKSVAKDFERLNKIGLGKARKEVEKLFDLSNVQDISVIEGFIKNIDKTVKTGFFGVTKEFQAEIKRVLEERIKILQGVAVTEDQITTQKEAQKVIEEELERLEKDRQSLSQVILDNELEKLRTLGASKSEILKAEEAYNKLLNISREEKDILKNKLELERAVAEEKKLQSRLGSDSIKLFKIAQAQGTDIARQISEALSGEVDFSTFIRKGGEAVDVFKKEFADLFEQQQALDFFKGNVTTGINTLRGGQNINIDEELARRSIGRGDINRIASREGVLPANTAQAVNNLSQINNITNTFSIIANNPKEVQNYLIKAFEDPQVKKALAQMISGDKQTNVL